MGALDGVTVLDLSIIVQGPQAAAMLHDLGAEVVKVELPGVGDLARWIHLADDDPRSGFFEACNRGKRSVTLDLRTPGGREACLRLAARSDVLVANFVPGTLERWGLSYEEVAAVNSGIVYATGSTFGPVGPMAQREGADTSGQASGGLIAGTGLDGSEPTPVGAVIADVTGSQNMVVGILAALLHRDRNGGRGQRIDVSLLGGQIWAQASEYTAHLLTGRPQQRSNRGHPMIRGVLRQFATADGHLVLVGVPGSLWPGFARALGRPELADDERFNTLFLTPENLAALFGILEEIFATRTSDEWDERLTAEGQRHAIVRTHEQVAADPHTWENGYLAEGDHPQWGRIKVVGCPIRFSATPAEPGIAAPELGQHTEEVLLELGYSWDEIGQLREVGAC
ncbi:MAG: CoA transferase [Acidimicrobiia bacterium]|nr:CoA transferase [Acidimicrobiia bacterium]MDH5289085.1 CoA transferase [Acidimicrobiia bacterium]